MQEHDIVLLTKQVGEHLIGTRATIVHLYKPLPFLPLIMEIEIDNETYTVEDSDVEPDPFTLQVTQEQVVEYVYDNHDNREVLGGKDKPVFITVRGIYHEEEIEDYVSSYLDGRPCVYMGNHDISDFTEFLIDSSRYELVDGDIKEKQH